MRLPVNRTIPFAVFALLSGCIAGGQKIASAQEPSAANGPGADYPIVIGKPFTIGDVNYVPSDALNSDQVGYAALSGEGGEAISIAHKTLPLPSYAEVTALDSGKTVLVRVERRGPMTNDRLIELSPGAAAQLGLSGRDKSPIRIRRVNPPENERALLRSGYRAPDRMDTPQSLLNVLKRKLDPQLATPAIAMPEPVPSPVSAATVPVVVPVPVPVQKSVAKKKPAQQPVATSPSAVPGSQAVATNRPVVQTAPSQSPVTAPVTAGPAGSLFIQVGAFADQNNANRATEKLGATKRPAGKFTRVVMGPYTSRAEAEAALVKAKQAGYTDARIQSAR